jgi:zinc transporter 2
MHFVILYLISADVIQSIGLLISSLFIFFLGSDKGAHVEEWNDWHYFDPISTYIFSVIVIISTFPIVKNCYYIIMEATPSTEMAL